MTNVQETIRNYVLTNVNDKQPLVFQGLHSSWAPVSWSLDEWGGFLKENLRDDLLTVRAGLRSHLTQKVQWEADCKKIRIPWDTITTWDTNDLSTLDNGTTCKTHWLYYDYKYMDHILSKNGQEMFTWSAAGFPDRNGSQSTLWIGTNGAYTPFHYDTYGCNLVTQVYGSKTWTLFPPKDTEHLLATRTPYEESSVYSRINLMKPTSADILQLSNCTALEVTLKPGDVLYVPPKWWHFVVHDEMSISVNTWIELPEDNETRLEEAVMKSLVCAISNLASVSSVSQILNPNEAEILELDGTDINEMLQSCSRKLLRNKPPTQTETGYVDRGYVELDSLEGFLEKVNPPAKRSRLSINENQPSGSESVVHEIFETGTVAKKLTSKVFGLDSEASIAKKVAGQCVTNNVSELAHLINALGHPTVLKEIAKRFLHNVQHNEYAISIVK